MGLYKSHANIGSSHLCVVNLYLTHSDCICQESPHEYHYLSGVGITGGSEAGTPLYFLVEVCLASVEIIVASRII